MRNDMSFMPPSKAHENGTGGPRTCIMYDTRPAPNLNRYDNGKPIGRRR